MPSIVSCSFSTAPPLPAPRTSAIFVRMLSRYAGRSVGQILHLSRHAPAGEAEHGEHQRDHDEHGRDAADPTLERGHGWRQDECQKEGECEGHEDGVRPVQDDHDQHTPCERHPRFHDLGRVIHRRLV